LVAAVVEIVRMAVPAPAPVIATGLVEPKLRLGAYWDPEGLEVTVAVSATLPVKPPLGVTVMVEVLPVVAPGVTVTAGPLIVKLGAGRIMVNVALATALVRYPLAVAIASIVSVDDTVIGPVYTVEPVVGVVPLVV
jgi:hypothetical protein